MWHFSNLVYLIVNPSSLRSKIKIRLFREKPRLVLTKQPNSTLGMSRSFVNLNVTSFCLWTRVITISRLTFKICHQHYKFNIYARKCEMSHAAWHSTRTTYRTWRITIPKAVCERNLEWIMPGIIYSLA